MSHQDADTKSLAGASTSPPANAPDKRREETLSRLRSALLEERLAVLELSNENTGADPYNSGIRRSPLNFAGWNKRSR